MLRAGWGAYRLAGAADPAALEFPDEAQYWQMARSLRDGEGLRDELGFQATRMPLYPAFLSMFMWDRISTGQSVVIAKAFQWLIGATVAIAVGVLGSTLINRRVGLVAAAFVALDPFFVLFSSLLLTETLFLLALTILFCTIAPLINDPIDDAGERGPRSRGCRLWQWAAVGLCAALCTYVRESSLGLFFLLSLFLLMLHRFDRRSMTGVAVAWLIVVVALLPWAARNRSRIGEWCWLTTRAGISLFDGVGPQATGASDLGHVKRMDVVRELSETEWNRHFLQASVGALRDDPWRAVRLAGVKLARMWNPFPNVQTYQSQMARWGSATWVLPIYALAAFGIARCVAGQVRHGTRVAAFLILPAAYLSALHSLFVGSVRYRLGAMPMLEILAAVGLVGLWSTLHGRGTHVQADSNESTVAMP